MSAQNTQPQEVNPLPLGYYGIIGLLIAYLIFLYSGFMRVNAGMLVTMFPWLLKQPGYQLYDTVITQYPPGGIWLGMLFEAIIKPPLLRARLLMIAYVSGSLLVIFRLARKWWGDKPALFGAVYYALWAPVCMVYLAYFDVLIGIFTLIAVSCWHNTNAKRWQPFLAGLALGAGFLIKPQILTALIVFMIWRALSAQKHNLFSDILLLLVGSLLPVIGAILFMAVQGSLSDMLFWAWSFNFSSYANASARYPGLDDIVLLVALVSPVPLFARWVIPQRKQWQREGILLLGLLVSMFTLAYPRYGRMHLSGVIPIIALISAGAAVYVLKLIKETAGVRRVIGGLYSLGVVLGLVSALALPTYYRAKLGSFTGEFEPLKSVAEAFIAETDVSPGTQVWLLTDIDPTTNFYIISGLHPATIQIQSYSWFLAVPGIQQRLITELTSSPPPYAVVFENWYADIPELFLDHLNAFYVPFHSVDSEYGPVTFYQLAP